MNKLFSEILPKNFFALFFFLLLFSSLNYYQMPWDEAIEDALVSLDYKIRGSRSPGNEFVIIYLADEDLQALGGWPLSRDYYSYLIHVLKSSGAKVIAIDVLFAQTDSRHPEYDKTMAQFIASSANVCLPMIFSQLEPKVNTSSYPINEKFFGENPTLPLKSIRDSAAGLGFSNFSRTENLFRIPLLATSGDSTFYSFGAEMARLYLVDSQDRRTSKKTQNPILPDGNSLLELNYFGDIDDVQSYSFVSLLQKFQQSPDSLNFTGKLALFTVTAPGISAVKSTPLSSTLPASFIHLTAAENLIHQNYLTRIPLPWQEAIIIFVLLALFLGFRFKADRNYILFATGILLLLWLISIFSFSLENTIIPIFYPSLALIASFFYFLVDRLSQKRLLQTSMQELLQQQIAGKEAQLKEIREQLSLQETTTEEFISLAEQRKQKILKLEKDVNDLKIYSEPVKNELKVSSGFGEIIYAETSPMAQILELVLKVSPNDIPVLITGETGTGKELIARAIHTSSNRKKNPFIAVNCGALSETLLESELFGHEKGSFTGAITLRRGRFEIANGGSIFLDEISETSPAFQAKLLRVLQDSTFERLGGEQTLKTNIRIIAASNRNLEEEKGQNFRTDLFYRLNGFPIKLPPLRERKDDLPLLVHHFLHKYDFELEISDQAMNFLKKYHWPGNVRELENHVRRAAILAQSDKRTLIQESDLAAELITAQENSKKEILHIPLEEQILEAMRSFEFSHASISQTAKVLGNRDRGTITEYFRGICFEYLVKTNFNLERVARDISASDDEIVIEAVKNKIKTYLENLTTDIQNKTAPSFKGLPKKYHPFLEKVLVHLKTQ